MKNSSSPNLERNARVKARLLPDGYVVLHSAEDNWVYTLTPLGGLVWEFCDGKNNIDSIANKISLMTDLSISPDQMTETFKLVAELQERGLLNSSET
jgi:hypothetical protein